MARQIYNDTWASTGDKVDPGGVKTTLGWIVEAPAHEYFNFWQGKADEMLQHLERNGIAEYNASTIYELGGYAREGTATYRSLVSTNTGNTPSTSPSEWVQAFLVPSNNLSDLTNAATARTNLGVDAAGTINYSHPNHSGDVTSVSDGAQTIAANVVSNSKLADIAQNSIKGRIGAGTGDPQDLTAANVRTIINVADNANNYSHPNHTGEVTSTGDGATVLDVTAITAKTALTSGLEATDELLISDNGTIKRMDASVLKTFTNSGISVGKNLIINGNFDVWQRGTSFPAIANGEYTVDRYLYNKVGSMVHTISQEPDVPSASELGFKASSSLLMDCTTIDAALSSTDYTVIAHYIEGYNFSRIAEQEFTISFWHKHTKTGTYCVGFTNSGFDRSYVEEYTQTVSDTWEKATITVSASPSSGSWDYTTGAGLRVRFTLASGSSYQTTAGAWQTGSFFATSNQVNACDSTANNFRIAAVQLEKGDTATDFEYKPVGAEELLCYRYYYKTLRIFYAAPRVNSTVTLLRLGAWEFPTLFRSDPTTFIPSHSGWSGTPDLQATKDQAILFGTASGASTVTLAGAGATFDAEL